MKTLLKSLAFVGLVVGSISGVYAATNPGAATTGVGAGLTSTGDFIINAYKQDAIRISGLADINLTPTMGSSVSSSNGNVCVFATSNTYSLTLNSTNNFKVKDAVSTNLMDYTLTWTDGANVKTFTTAAANNNVVQSALVSNNKTDELCATATKSTIDVAIAAAQFTGKAVGTYSDTVVVTIATE